MVLDLRRLFDVEGEAVSLTYSLDLSDVEHWGVFPFDRPVMVTGKIENRAKIVTMSYTAQISVSLCCDRCLSQIHREYSRQFTHNLVQKLYNEDDNDTYVVVESGFLELPPLLKTDILLDFPHKHLCKEDCKGLCPKCGINLNQATCNCATKEVDPRFAKLLDLLP